MSRSSPVKFLSHSYSIYFSSLEIATISDDFPTYFPLLAPPGTCNLATHFFESFLVPACSFENSHESMKGLSSKSSHMLLISIHLPFSYETAFVIVLYFKVRFPSSCRLKYEIHIQACIHTVQAATGKLTPRSICWLILKPCTSPHTTLKAHSGLHKTSLCFLPLVLPAALFVSEGEFSSGVTDWSAVAVARVTASDRIWQFSAAAALSRLVTSLVPTAITGPVSALHSSLICYGHSSGGAVHPGNCWLWLRVFVKQKMCVWKGKKGHACAFILLGLIHVS